MFESAQVDSGPGLHETPKHACLEDVARGYGVTCPESRIQFRRAVLESQRHVAVPSFSVPGGRAGKGSSHSISTMAHGWTCPFRRTGLCMGTRNPVYVDVSLPFPIDPPFVPSENPTGDHRRSFDLPEDWPEDGDTVLRFDGVESCCRAWLNGLELRRLDGESSPGRVLRRRRVAAGTESARRSSSSVVGRQLPGRPRHVVAPRHLPRCHALSRPVGSVRDFFVHADYEYASGTGTLTVEASPAGTVTLEELGIAHHPTGEPITCRVEPWSAEAPRLYTGVLETEGETVPFRVGFRNVRVHDGLIKVNGHPLLFRGVNRHEWDPDDGRALSFDRMLEDVRLMKQHNINAVRTSHYPPHPTFLDLCVGTDSGSSTSATWKRRSSRRSAGGGTPADDSGLGGDVRRSSSAYGQRDKNHPSVVMWSMGNESNSGCNLAAMSSWVRGRIRSRLIHSHERR